MGLSDAEFWGLTFRQFVALQDRWSDRRENEIEYQANTINIFANLASMYHKVNFKNPHPEPKGFLVSHNRLKPKPKQTSQEMLEAMKRITLAQGGEIKLIQGNN